MHNRFKQVALRDKLLYVKRRELEDKKQEYNLLLRKTLHREQPEQENTSIEISNSGDL
jgi:hypothetical protein